MDADAFEWMEGDAYKLDLWVPLDGAGFPPRGIYYFGIDLSRGVGGELSSNSCISIFNELREQVGELADNTISPVEFAHLAVALAYWFGHGEPTTKINWEIEGPGIEFGREIQRRLNYTNLRPRPVSDERRFNHKPTGAFGTANKDRDKALTPLVSALVSQTVTIRSKALLEECGQYIFDENGKPIHPRSKTARDGSAKGMSHGDRVIGASMAVLFMDECATERKRSKKRSETIVPSVIPPNSIAGRMLARKRSDAARQDRFCRW